MIIHKQDIQDGIPKYEIITKKFKSITVKFDETFNKNDIYRLLSLLENDVDKMHFSHAWLLFSATRIYKFKVQKVKDPCFKRSNNGFKVACPLTTDTLNAIIPKILILITIKSANVNQSCPLWWFREKLWTFLTLALFY